jgi:hypothetical protein
VKTVLAYFLALIAAPFLGGLLSLLPIGVIVTALGRLEKKGFLRPGHVMVISAIPAGLITGWLGLLAFSWMNLPAPRALWVVQAIFIAGAAANNSRNGKPYAGSLGWGQVIGLALAGRWLQ